MKKLLLLGALCLALLLGGCGGSRAAERREGLAAALNARQDLQFTAALRAEYPDKTVRFRLRYTQDANGCAVTVLEPEEIAGISLAFRADGSQLRFEDLRLDTGPLDRYGLSPVSALPALVDALRSGHLERHWNEGELEVWELAVSDSLRVQVWLDASLVPQRAELISEDRVAVFCEIADWQ